MNKTLRKAMLSTICMLVVAVVSLTGVTYAWFSQGTYAEIDGLTVNVEAADGGIMVAGAEEYNSEDMPDDADYSNTLDLNALNFGGNDGVSPVSTVGGKDAFNFFTANLVTPTEITTAADPTDSGNVYKYYLFLRNENSGEDMHINLGGNGTQSPVTSITNSDLKTIENAARIGLRYVATKAINGTAGTGNVNGTTGYGIFSNEAKTKGNTEDNYLGVKGVGTQFVKDNANLTDQLGAVNPMPATEWDILVPQDSIVVVELYVWVEGQDDNCINANANSNFAVNLVFDKVPAQAEVTD